ncbi:unnamed protein product [Psylliodes chrysocephalus]|uniref:Myb/SANT-like DNA-binding domain-containing protein n=1 Tax=Psylliodes chrysocephalus TaxID=3402493 RepID=A0A9P0CR41_9CUCU|nr:unnamed protein product [Psylliodes chrysocephala]
MHSLPLCSQAPQFIFFVDLYFASELLRRTINQNPHAASTSTAYVQYDDDEETPESFCEDEIPISNEDTGETNCETEESEGGVSSYRWTSPAVLLLLESYRSMEEIRNRGKMSQKQMWKKISEEFNKKGYTVTGPQCDSKLRIGSDSSSKSKKTPIATLLGKRLKQKEEHEENKNKRQKERMEMDAKFLKVLEKLAEK